MDDEDEGDVPILAFEEVNMFAVGGDFPRNISKLATLQHTFDIFDHTINSNRLMSQSP